MIQNAGDYTNHSIGHEHAHAHAHAHDHAHRSAPRLNPYAILASEIAQQPMDDWMAELEIRSRALGLYECLFPYSSSKENSRNQKKGSDEDELANRIASAEQEPEEALEGVGFSIGSILHRNRLVSLTKEEQTFLGQLAHSLIDPFRDDKDAYTYFDNESTNSQGPDYGRLTYTTVELAEVLDVTPERAEAIRTVLASRLLPIGLGWRSRYEYHCFLATYLFNCDTSAFNAEEKEGYLTFRLKQQIEERLGEESASLWKLLEQFTRYQLDRYHNLGIEPRTPRSASRLAKLLACTVPMAHHLIELHRQLPHTPLEDMILFETYKRTRRNSSSAAGTPEARLVWSERDGRYYCQWVSRMSDRIASLQNPGTQAHMKALGVLSQLNIEEQMSGEEVQTQAMQLDPSLDKDSVSEVTDRYLASMGYSDLVNETSEIEVSIQGRGAKKTKTAKLLKSIKRLNALHAIYNSLMESFEFKPQLIEYVANYQQDFLDDGRPETLKPLTKAQVVRALGFESSGGNGNKQTLSQKERGKMNTGRRLERYMKCLWIELPDGHPIALESLIPGCSGVQDTAKTPISSVAVKEYLRKIVNNESAEAPYSDQKLVKLLYERFGVCIARKTVAKYREAIDIPNSQRRRIIQMINNENATG